MTLRIELADEAATARLGADLAMALQKGDCIALSGDLGAGKTTLARGAIRTLAGNPALDVPSPTFTLMQSYPGRLPVAHVDLYRIAEPREMSELGLEEALDGGVAFIEWAERAFDHLPASLIRVTLSHSGEGRLASIDAGSDELARIERSIAIRGFLVEAGWGRADRTHLQGDASSRTYETIVQSNSEPRVLMNAPRRPDGPPIRDGLPYSRIAHLAESVTPFVAVSNVLRQNGFSAPDVYAADLDGGLLLIEHLGSDSFLGETGEPVPERYRAAAALLADMHGLQWPGQIEAAPGVHHVPPNFDRDAMMIEAELLLDWYLPHVSGTAPSDTTRENYRAAWEEVISRLASAETSLVLRDYHSPNLIWREDRVGKDRLGLLDFQDAVIGPAAYDVASLAMDARVMIPPDLEAATVEAYCAARNVGGGFDRTGFEAAYAIMAAQRNAKILGIFVRLNKRDGKPQYLRHLPRIRDYFARALVYPALEPVRSFAASHALIDQP